MVEERSLQLLRRAAHYTTAHSTSGSLVFTATFSIAFPAPVAHTAATTLALAKPTAAFTATALRLSHASVRNPTCTAVALEPTLCTFAVPPVAVALEPTGAVAPAAVAALCATVAVVPACMRQHTRTNRRTDDWPTVPTVLVYGAPRLGLDVRRVLHEWRCWWHQQLLRRRGRDVLPCHARYCLCTAHVPATAVAFTVAAVAAVAVFAAVAGFAPVSLLASPTRRAAAQPARR